MLRTAQLANVRIHPMNEALDFPLFPPIEPYRTGNLPVDALHTLYWEECGNPDGLPVIYLQGGPGAGASPQKRQFWDPEYYRIVLFDQRAAFRSTPLAEHRNNTTRLLLDDIEALRNMLGIERWLVAGGSWGTTLSLAYGQAHPEACLGFILRGVFLGTAQEIDWFLHGMRLFFPKAHDDFVGWIPEPERHDILTAYEKRLFSDDPGIHMPAARHWVAYAESCSLLRHDANVVEKGISNDAVTFGTAKLDAYFFRNRMFLQEDQLIKNIGSIAHVPCVIVQGGHDMVAPPAAAYRLHQAWSGSVLQMVADAGHSPSEPGIRSRLIQASEQFKRARRFD
jgi:proline iminopeptidase